MTMAGRPIKIDHYGDCRKKRNITIPMDEEMIYWLRRLAEMNDNQDRDDNTLIKIVRSACYIHLKMRLPNHFKMSEQYFKDHNERTGKLYNGERW